MTFPMSLYSDQVDMLSQALTYLEPALWREFQAEGEAVKRAEQEAQKTEKQRFTERLHALSLPRPPTRRLLYRRRR